MGLESKAEHQADGHPATSKAGTGQPAHSGSSGGAGEGWMDGGRKVLREC